MPKYFRFPVQNVLRSSPLVTQARRSQVAIPRSESREPVRMRRKRDTLEGPHSGGGSSRGRGSPRTRRRTCLSCLRRRATRNPAARLGYDRRRRFLGVVAAHAPPFSPASLRTVPAGNPHAASRERRSSPACLSFSSQSSLRSDGKTRFGASRPDWGVPAAIPRRCCRQGCSRTRS